LKSHRAGIADGLWETTAMAKHQFEIAKTDIRGKVVGVQCVRCGKIALLMSNGAVSKDLSEEECSREDASQASVRGVREATEGN
jgi:hypothetical protein